MVSLGCAKNQVDSEMILGAMKDSITLVESPIDANLILINTCAFIEPARKEAIDTILQMADYKKNGAKLVVLGCLPQRYKDEIIKLLPEVDRFITIDEYRNIAKIIEGVMKGDYKIQGEYSPLNRIYSTPSYMRYIKISEGCQNHCAFCAIPLIRGTLRSRPMESIIEEVKNEVASGVYEINLISQDTTKYGYDLYDKKLMIVPLLEELCKIDGDFKIRLLYLYPDIVTDELIEFIKTHDKVMPYFDIPIQHSEDKILKAMKRRGSREYLLSLFKKIRKEIPNAILRTTFIVGFPYETEEDMDNLIEFIKEVKFDRLGCFTFSLEEGTLATTYPDEISEDEKHRRYERLMSTQSEIALKNNKEKFVGKNIKCFVIGYDEQSYMYMARNYMFAPDDIDGCIYFAGKDEHKLGDIVEVKILNCDEYNLDGEEI
jgi:ribosomal protein S12 methylthiotransferase